MKPNIVWLASYPKSGNTWFRVFLTALLNGDKNQSPDINKLYETSIASSRGIFDEQTGLESSDLLESEIDALRPEIYNGLSEGNDGVRYIKVHDACTRTEDGRWLFPPEVTKGVIYLVRNPLDVAVSFANHMSFTFSKTVEEMCREDFTLSSPKKKRLSLQLKQRQLSWGSHVLSWTHSPYPVCVLRYEDMTFNAFETFKRAVSFLGLDKSDDDIHSAIELSSFDRLREQEELHSFSEKPANCDYFFRKGIVGDWRNYLDSEYCQKLVSYHYEVMKQFGYLDNTGQPQF